VLGTWRCKTPYYTCPKSLSLLFAPLPVNVVGPRALFYTCRGEHQQIKQRKGDIDSSISMGDVRDSLSTDVINTLLAGWCISAAFLTSNHSVGGSGLMKVDPVQ
jgi:hypothetical protein